MRAWRNLKYVECNLRVCLAYNILSGKSCIIHWFFLKHFIHRCIYLKSLKIHYFESDNGRTPSHDGKITNTVNVF